MPELANYQNKDMRIQLLYTHAFPGYQCVRDADKHFALALF